MWVGEEFVCGTTAAAAPLLPRTPGGVHGWLGAADVGVARAKRVRYSGASVAGK
jgi:hypothetical protein